MRLLFYLILVHPALFILLHAFFLLRISLIGLRTSFAVPSQKMTYNTNQKFTTHIGKPASLHGADVGYLPSPLRYMSPEMIVVSPTVALTIKRQTYR